MVVYLDPEDVHIQMRVEPGRIVLVWRQQKIGYIGIERKKDAARIYVGRLADEQVFKKYEQQLLVIALAQLKKDRIWKIIVLGRLENVAKELGYSQTRLLDMKNALVRAPVKEKPVARYAGKSTIYELIVKKQTKTGYYSIFTENGIPTTYVKWRVGKEIRHIDKVTSGLENKRMTKTLLIYTLWEMKQKGLGKASLMFIPEKGKEKQAEGLYHSIGFKRRSYSLEWVFDLEKTRLQKMYLK